MSDKLSSTLDASQLEEITYPGPLPFLKTRPEKLPVELRFLLIWLRPRRASNNLVRQMFSTYGQKNRPTLSPLGPRDMLANLQCGLRDTLLQAHAFPQQHRRRSPRLSEQYQTCPTPFHRLATSWWIYERGSSIFR